MSEKRAFILVAIIAALGTVNAGYLAWTALVGVAPTCNFIHGCDVVAASPYSQIFGIPLALFGVFFYLSIFSFSIWRVFVSTAPAIWYILLLSTVGFILSLYFLYLQAFVIEAFCEYCLFSLLDATVLFTLSFYLWKRQDKQGSMEVLKS
jgi:uncharacterized membrane protein